jgi:hypothetical protein
MVRRGGAAAGEGHGRGLGRGTLGPWGAACARSRASVCCGARVHTPAPPACHLLTYRPDDPQVEYAERTCDDILEANIDKTADPGARPGSEAAARCSSPPNERRPARPGPRSSLPSPSARPPLLLTSSPPARAPNTTPPCAAEWKLDSLAAKMTQYCPLLEGLTGEELQKQSSGSFEVRPPRGVGLGEGSRLAPGASRPRCGGAFLQPSSPPAASPILTPDPRLPSTPPPHSPPKGLRAYLRQLAVAAYRQKADAVDGLEAGLMQEAQKFFVLTQTDNLWKEHLQVGARGLGLRAWVQRR